MSAFHAINPWFVWCPLCRFFCCRRGAVKHPQSTFRWGGEKVKHQVRDVCQPHTTTPPLRGSKAHYTRLRPRLTEPLSFFLSQLLFPTQQRKACCSSIHRGIVFLWFPVVCTHDAVNCEPAVELSAKTQPHSTVLFSGWKKRVLICPLHPSFSANIWATSQEKQGETLYSVTLYDNVSDVILCNKYNIHLIALQIKACLVQKNKTKQKSC